MAFQPAHLSARLPRSLHPESLHLALVMPRDEHPPELVAVASCRHHQRRHPGSPGCLLEPTRRGANPLRLSIGETRIFLEDGDRMTMRAWCEGQGYRVGFGEVTGKILPALEG